MEWHTPSQRVFRGGATNLRYRTLQRCFHCCCLLSGAYPSVLDKENFRDPRPRQRTRHEVSMTTGNPPTSLTSKPQNPYGVVRGPAGLCHSFVSPSFWWRALTSSVFLAFNARRARDILPLSLGKGLISLSFSPSDERA